MRLIDADACESYFYEHLDDSGMAAAMNAINDMPTIELEIVRCKDCKHRDPEDHKCDCGHDIIWQLPRGDKWYCADAERRTDEQDSE